MFYGYKRLYCIARLKILLSMLKKVTLFRLNILLLSLLIQACATDPVSPVPVETVKEISAQVRALSSDQLHNGLHRQYAQWKGTRYQFGGLSNKGIDCSGFVHVTFKKQFSINLPRTTVEQKSLGSEVLRKSLQVGDLVFFKTGKRFYHVGIYLKDDHFLHVSSSKGVMISSLDNIYWNKRYLLSRRL